MLACAYMVNQPHSYARLPLPPGFAAAHFHWCSDELPRLFGRRPSLRQSSSPCHATVGQLLHSVVWEKSYLVVTQSLVVEKALSGAEGAGWDFFHAIRRLEHGSFSLVPFFKSWYGVAPYVACLSVEAHVAVHCRAT